MDEILQCFIDESKPDLESFPISGQTETESRVAVWLNVLFYNFIRFQSLIKKLYKLCIILYKCKHVCLWAPCPSTAFEQMYFIVLSH